MDTAINIYRLKISIINLYVDSLGKGVKSKFERLKKKLDTDYVFKIACGQSLNAFSDLKFTVHALMYYYENMSLYFKQTGDEKKSEYFFRLKKKYEILVEKLDEIENENMVMHAAASMRTIKYSVRIFIKIENLYYLMETTDYGKMSKEDIEKELSDHFKKSIKIK